MKFFTKNKIFIFIGIILLTALGLRFFSGEDNWVCQNGQWVAHGKPAAEKPQEGCGVQIAPPAQTIQTENVRNLNIQPNQEIFSPLIITGEARKWYFEGSFPVMLVNWDGLIIAQGTAQAEGDWMTENFVPFKATLIFTKPDYKDNGSLILKKDNPSGLPQFDEAVEIPIKFK
ncbi:MAG: Gmad2 immunoglobulin-like domain-containing protein [Candidatus Doudnabacteria bacterium]|jgi:hypothetical protein